MGNTRSTSLDSVTMKHRQLSSKQHHSNSSISPTRRKRSLSSDSVGDFGWYEDFESPSVHNALTGESEFPILTLPAPVTEPPLYVLESSLETQQLWYTTAGRRPVQPAQEREYFEKLWSKNFESSEIIYNQNEEPAEQTYLSCNINSKSRHVENEILFRGKSPFSNSVSKSFTNQPLSSMTLQLPYYRIVRDCRTGSVYAEFLIVISLGGRGAVQFGIWKRFSEFTKLAKKLTELDLRAPPPYSFRNSLLSWQCVMERKRWFKSLDKDYLSLKCFLIERFMHDLLFETPTPAIISDFLGLE